MNFTIPKNATTEEVEAIIERGMDAMMDAVDGDSDADVCFLHEGSEEAIAAEKNQNTSGKTDGDGGGDIADDDDNKNDNKKGVDDECPECGEDPCVFFQHEELLVAYDDAEYGLTTSVEPLPDNNIRRKKLYRQLTLMLNGGPLGAGVRKPLPSCCVSAIRDMHPSDTFMGFKSD
jgi:DNA-directed RNA polymerase subunit M/transcription elongation factor TFIIS